VDHCGDFLYYDEGWFVCTLPTAHAGRHRDDITGADGDDFGARRGMTVEWDQEPATVTGVVVP
jgi:hypothetical protein